MRFTVAFSSLSHAKSTSYQGKFDFEKGENYMPQKKNAVQDYKKSFYCKSTYCYFYYGNMCRGWLSRKQGTRRKKKLYPQDEKHKKIIQKKSKSHVTSFYSCLVI